MFKDGKRLHTPFFTLIVAASPQQFREGRVAFIAGKRLGNAVWRNRAKRRMRSVCYELGGSVPGLDLIFLAKAKVETADYEALRSAASKAFEQVKVGETDEVIG